MDENDISRLFMRFARSAGTVPEEASQVFSILVSTTLAYRDRLKETGNITLTVQDVRTCLDLLLAAMHTRRLPQTDNLIHIDLVKLWLDELKPYM